MYKNRIQALARRWRDLTGQWTSTMEDMKQAERLALDTLAMLGPIRQLGLPLHFAEKIVKVMDLSALAQFTGSRDDMPKVFYDAEYISTQIQSIGAKAGNMPSWTAKIIEEAPTRARDLSGSIAVGEYCGCFTLTNCDWTKGTVLLDMEAEPKGQRFMLDALVESLRRTLYNLRAVRGDWAVMMPIYEDLVLLAMYDSEAAVSSAQIYDAAGRTTYAKTEEGKRRAGELLAKIHTGVIGYKMFTPKQEKA